MTASRTGRRAAGRLISPLLSMLFLRSQIADVSLITPRMRLIGLTGPELAGLSWIPGQQVRVRTTAAQGPSALRTYSVWRYDRDRLELCVLDHGEGPGARWAREARPGDEVLFRKPEGTFVATNTAPHHLFAGEETASVAFGAMLRALPSGVPVHGAIEVAGPGDRLPLSRSAELAWHFRADAARGRIRQPGRRGPGARPARRAGRRLPGQEACTCQPVRAHLVSERGWPRRSVLVKPFWAPGKRGLE
jgi:NADPH-dependent ferric siderophore reductase